MDKDTGHKSDTSTLTLEKGEDSCVAVNDGTERPDDYDRKLKTIKRIMKDNDELLSKLAKL